MHTHTDVYVRINVHMLHCQAILVIKMHCVNMSAVSSTGRCEKSSSR